MSSSEFVVTKNVDSVVRTFLDAPDEDLWGYLIKKRTGLGQGSVYEVLARMGRAGWVVRTEATAPSGGQPRVTYRLNQNQLPAIRDQLAAAHLERARTTAAKSRRRVPARSSANNPLRPRPGV